MGITWETDAPKPVGTVLASLKTALEPAAAAAVQVAAVHDAAVHDAAVVAAQLDNTAPFFDEASS